jgi:hypothetical protein
LSWRGHPREPRVDAGLAKRSRGSAEQNIALHKAVLRKLAENGGRFPDSLKR